MSEMLFETPEFLKEQGVKEIHDRMMASLPSDLDKSEQQFPWDFTRPTAIEIARMAQFLMPEAIKLLFPQFCSGGWLDRHGETRGLSRTEALHAKGSLDIKGEDDTIIPKGFKLFAKATDDSASIIFVAKEEYKLPLPEDKKVEVLALNPGVEGNVAQNTITHMVTPLEGITSITNPKALENGASQESDDDFRNRIRAYDSTQGFSFVGNLNDYERWATEETGVRSVVVTGPKKDDDAGTVKIILLEDIDGNPIVDAGQSEHEGQTDEKDSNFSFYYQRVWDKIMGTTGNPSTRLAPVNANIDITCSKLMPIYIEAEIITEEKAAPGDTSKIIDEIKENFSKQLKEYYKKATAKGVIRINEIGAILMATDKVSDYSCLRLSKDGETYITEKIVIEAYEDCPATEKENISFIIAGANYL